MLESRSSYIRGVCLLFAVQAIQERHENSLLKSEIDKLRDEHRAMRVSMKKQSCPNCGFPSPTSKEALTPTQDHKLREENLRLKAEVRKHVIVQKKRKKTSAFSRMS